MDKQCESCIYNPFRQELTCCALAELRWSWRELLRSIQVIRKNVEPYRCGWHQEDYEIYKGDRDGRV